MSAHFAVRTRNEFGVLQRILGTVRRRGFAVASIYAVEAENGENLQVDMRLKGSRSTKALAKHLLNLTDIQSVVVSNIEIATEYAC